MGFREGNEFPPVLASSGNLVNGMHRLVASCLYGFDKLKVKEVRSPYRYNQTFFKNYINPNTGNKIPVKIYEMMGLSLCQTIPTCAIVLHPKCLSEDRGKYALMKIRHNSKIIYEHNLRYNIFDSPYIYYQLYGHQSWLSPMQDNRQLIMSIYGKILGCCDTRESSMKSKVIFIKPINQNDLTALKADIREYYKIGNHSVHTTDEPEEARDIAYSLMTNKKNWSF